MKMLISQISDLQEGNVVGEQEFDDESPADIQDVLALVLRNCTQYLRKEERPITQTSIKLEKLVLSYPGVAGVIEVTFGFPED